MKDRELKRWQGFNWGRVQVDPMRGTFDQASVYVISPDKDKPTDPSPIRFPNQDAKFCSCKASELFFSQARSVQNFEKRLCQLKLKFGLMDWGQYEEERERLIRYLSITEEYLDQFSWCRDCQLRPLVYHRWAEAALSRVQSLPQADSISAPNFFST